MEIVEKKQYPSQINSKTISARVPVQDYVNFLNESIELGISLNDFLLRKIYSNNQSVGNVKSMEQGGEVPPEILNFLNGFKDWDIVVPESESLNEFLTNSGIYNNPILNNGDGVLRVHIKAMRGYYYTLQELIDGFNNLIYIDIKRKQNADLMDVKNQLTILIQNRFEDMGDRKAFRKEIYELLKELE